MTLIPRRREGTTVTPESAGWRYLSFRVVSGVLEASTGDEEVCLVPGNATRQINHIVKPGFAAERLLVVEVFTPAGNWFSYPPHKHDVDALPGEVVLEETYYYRTDGFAVQRLYSPERNFDLTETVRDGDLMLVPWGYHATCAAHGYDLYYLNALAGDRRSMASSDDPELAWIRGSWESLEPDPRVPLVS